MKKNKRQIAATEEMAALNRIIDKLDNIDDRLNLIEKNATKRALVTGSLAGGLSGAIVSLGVVLIKASI